VLYLRIDTILSMKIKNRDIVHLGMLLEKKSDSYESKENNYNNGICYDRFMLILFNKIT
jgi:hypothetical protein